jgi:ArsR family transcriptional regulator
MARGDGERWVCELQEQVGSDMSTVSKHLTILRSAGLVSSEKRGKQVFYSLEMPCTLGFIECIDRVLQKQNS